MSEFSVNVVRIDRVENHPNADRLTLNHIGGYVAISNKNEDGSYRYHAGDLVVYIPEQAVVPEWLLRQMGMWDEEKNKGILGGPGNVVKAIRLRGIFSQGILYPVVVDRMRSMFTDINELPTRNVVYRENKATYLVVNEDDDVAEFLDITKREEVVPEKFSGNCVYIGPDNTISYDIENYQKFPNLIRTERSVSAELERITNQYNSFAEIANQPPDKNEYINRNMNTLFGDGWRNFGEVSPAEQVVFTEKLHGTNIQIGIRPGLNNTELFHNGNVYVASKGLGAKGLVFKNTEDNVYTRSFLNLMKNDLFSAFVEQAIVEERDVTFIGEVFGEGVQDLTYGIKTPEIRIFDIYVGKPRHGHYVDDEIIVRITTMLNLSRVPVLYYGPFSKEIAEKYRDGKDTINGVNIREGIVIRPLVERRDSYGKRIQLKFVSPDYLLRKNGTEFN